MDCLQAVRVKDFGINFLRLTILKQSLYRWSLTSESSCWIAVQDHGLCIWFVFLRHLHNIFTNSFDKSKIQTTSFRSPDRQNWGPGFDDYAPKSLMFWKPGCICDGWALNVMSTVLKKIIRNGICNLHSS